MKNDQLKNRRKSMLERTERGFTLVELLVATFLLPVLFLSLYFLLNMSHVILSTNDIFAQLNQSAIQTLRNVSREIAQTNPVATPVRLVITTDANNNSVIRFQIPVDWDNDGDAVGNGVNNPVEWGAYDEAGQTNTSGILRPDILGRWVRYSVVNGQLVREILDPALATVAGSLRVIANNISPAAGAFVVAAPVNSIVRTTLTLRGIDQRGQMGAARTFADVPFMNETLLRVSTN